MIIYFFLLSIHLLSTIASTSQFSLCLLTYQIYYQFDILIILMQQIKPLFQLTKQSLLQTNKNNPDKGIEIIKQIQYKIKALRQSHPEHDQQLDEIEIICYNNLACAYNLKRKYRASLYNLQLASQIEARMFGDANTSNDPKVLHQVATTYSNICAVLSQMGEHEKAYKQINKAIQLLLKTKQTIQSDALLVFYFNCAVELEYLGRLNQAVKIARKGWSLSSSVNRQMQNKFVQLTQQLQQKIKQRQKKVAKMMFNSMKMRNHSTADEKSLTKRGNSLTLKFQKSLYQNAQLNEISKQYQTHNTKMPQIYGSKPYKKSEYPMIKLPSFYEIGENSSMVSKQKNRMNKTIGIQQQKNVISLYQPKSKERLALRNQRQHFRKREEKSLEKMVMQDLI